MNKELTLADEYNAISFMRWLLLDDSKQDKLVGLAIRNEE